MKKRNAYIILGILFVLVIVIIENSLKITYTGKKDNIHIKNEEDLSEQEPYNCVILSTGPKATEKACEQASEAASKITEAKFNITITIIRVPYGVYDNQVNLMLASGDKLDLFPNGGLSVTLGANNGLIVPMDNLLEQYGQDLIKNIPEADWNYTRVNGKIYGVRNNKEFALSFGYCMLKDVLDELGVDPETLKTEADINNLFYKVKQKYPDMWPIAPDAGTMGYYDAYFDSMGGDYGILKDCRNDNTTVVDMYETKEYYDIIEQRYKWMKEGLMLPDGSTNHINVTTLMKEGKVFACSSNIKPGKETEILQDTGIQVVSIPITDSFSTSNAYSNQWFIAKQSEKPDRAMLILNEMYSNPELSNILINGVEGVHWQLVDRQSGIIDYPEGVSAITSEYPASAWVWPNELISYTWAVSGPTLWQDTIEFNNNAIQSPLKGFTWNNAAVLSEIAECNNVASKYKNALDCGELDPAVYIPKFVEELKKAGVDSIIKEKQRQVDQWLTTQSK